MLTTIFQSNQFSLFESFSFFVLVLFLSIRPRNENENEPDLVPLVAAAAV
jgi:hypothetical protein